MKVEVNLPVIAGVIVGVVAVVCLSALRVERDRLQTERDTFCAAYRIRVTVDLRLLDDPTAVPKYRTHYADRLFETELDPDIRTLCAHDAVMPDGLDECWATSNYPCLTLAARRVLARMETP